MKVLNVNKFAAKTGKHFVNIYENTLSKYVGKQGDIVPQYDKLAPIYKDEKEFDDYNCFLNMSQKDYDKKVDELFAMYEDEIAMAGDRMSREYEAERTYELCKKKVHDEVRKAEELNHKEMLEQGEELKEGEPFFMICMETYHGHGDYLSRCVAISSNEHDAKVLAGHIKENYSCYKNSDFYLLDNNGKKIELETETENA